MASSGTYQDRTFNLAAQGHRQPGSAFKTMVLTTAIRKGIDPDSTTYTSKPLDLNIPGYGPWQVKTYGGSYGGSMNLYSATLASDNTVYAQLIIDVGPEAVCETAKLHGHPDQARLPARRGPRRPAAGRHPARDGERLRHAGRRRHPPPADGDPQGRLPRRQVRRALEPEAASAC